VRARITEILVNRLADVLTSIGVEDARIGQHLGRDRRDAWRLDDAIAVAVDHAKNRARDAARDAAFVEGEILPGVQRTRAVRAARHPALLLIHLDGRQTPGRRIHDQTRLREHATRVVESEAAFRARVALLCGVIDLRLSSSQCRFVEVKRWRLSGRRLRCGTPSRSSATWTATSLAS